ncbi:tryptophan decarboxylase-like [Branchiostoma floridae]|uniref:Tryptophan decarboxylase-like n=1 Tax=Branchiostoma floridae TaxID=7739 RepID=A0A9J7MNY7_BRAFL|nr:tryptophan decarboxylase-like [Branchiostoma floridae]XP_035674165.1 tryptophan decarboxylase-like [Branchiostoma floridae]
MAGANHNLRQRLADLKTKTSVLEVQEVDRDAMTKKTVQLINAYDDNVTKLTYGPIKMLDKGSLETRDDISENPVDFDSVMQDLNDRLVRAGVIPGHPMFLGFIPSGHGTYPAALGGFLPAAFTTYSVVHLESPAAVQMENRLIKWVADLFGYPAGHAGNISSGGSLATLTALAVARDSRELKAADFHRCVVYCSEFTHYAVQKGLRAVGMREAIMKTPPVDKELKMTAAALERQINDDKKAGLLPFLVVATVGTTLTGSVDPLNDIADVCDRHQLWLHVDAAYGGFFALCDEVKQLFVGVERSDSIVVNPHKGLFLPSGVGVLVVKDGKKLQECCFSEQTSSVFKGMQFFSADHLSPCELSFELTRSFRGAQMWLPLKMFGVGVFRAALEEKLLLARYFYGKLKETGEFELPLEPEVSVVVFRATAPPGVDINNFNQQLLNDLVSDGKIFMTPAELYGQFYLRVCVLCFRTHIEHIELCLALIREKRGHLWGSFQSNAL